MALLPLKPCATPGCRQLVRGAARCARHDAERRSEQAKEMETRIGKPAERGYDHEWRRARRDFLEAFPVCACGKPAAMVHHVVPLSRGGARLDPSNMASMCWGCHAKTHRSKHGLL